MRAAGFVPVLVAGGLVCSRLWAGAPAGQYTIVVDGGVVKDNRSRLTWQRGHSDGGLTWAEADTYCRALDLDANSSGWRTPTKFELETLVSDDSQQPAIDRTAFPDTRSEPFWTSTTYFPAPSDAWIVIFDDGRSYEYAPKSQRCLVRCVR